MISQLEQRILIIGHGNYGIRYIDEVCLIVKLTTFRVQSLKALCKQSHANIDAVTYVASKYLTTISVFVRAFCFAPIVPSAPPHNIQVKMVDNSTIYLTWEPPPKRFLNGVLRGYKVCGLLLFKRHNFAHTFDYCSWGGAV